MNLTLIIYSNEDDYCNLEKFSFQEYYQTLFVMFAFRFYVVSQLCSIIKHATYQILLISFLFHLFENYVTLLGSIFGLNCA